MGRSRLISRARLARFAVAVALLGCAPATLRYTPEWPPGVPISADYRVVGERLRVEIDSEGYRVEDARILRADGTTVTAEALAPPESRPVGGISLGLGIGGGGSVGAVGIGGGLGMGLPVGGSRAAGRTLAVFPLAEVGPAPWRLRVKVVGLDPVVIALDPAKPAR